MTRHNACVEPGDSGGANVSYIGGATAPRASLSGASMIEDHAARSSASRSSASSNMSWYFPIADSLAYYGPKYGVTTW